MRIRHVAIVLLAIGAALIVVQAAAPQPSAGPSLEDGAYNLSAARSGSGAWVPYTITVRNLSRHGELAGRLLLIKPAAAVTGPPPILNPLRGGPGAPAPLPARAHNSSPDGAFEFPIRLSPRHRRTLRLFAPSDFTQVILEDSAGRVVAEGAVDQRPVLGIGLLTSSATLAQALEPVTIGDLRLAVQAWDRSHPFPSRAIDLSGLSAVVVDSFDTARLSPLQVESLRQFVGLGGELVLLGGVELSRTVAGLPPELVPFQPSGGTLTSDLAAVAQLSSAPVHGAAVVASGTPRAGARVFVENDAGQPLGVESRYGEGSTVEVLFDPDPGLANPAPAELALASVVMQAAISRGLDHLPARGVAAGRTLVDPAGLPDALLPRPSDVPLPPLWVLAALIAAYLILVLPGNYLLLRSLGRATLTWYTAPVLALLFTAGLYAAGQTLQAGVRDQELQLVRLGPQGAVSIVDVHGLLFPGRGEHTVEFGPGLLAAPLTVAHPALAADCPGCPIPVAAGGAGVEEHVVAATPPRVIERGVLYGGVRVAAAGSIGRSDLQLEAALDSDGLRVSGTIANTGRVRVQPLLIYTYARGAYRGGPVVPFLEPGQTVTFSTGLNPIREPAASLGTGRLTPFQQASLLADEMARRTLTHRGQLALVGLVPPVRSSISVDGAAPQRRVLTVFGLPTEITSTAGDLGDTANVRLAAVTVQPDGTLLDTYDIAIPELAGPIRLRIDTRLHSDVQVYDWAAREWRSGGFVEDLQSPLVAQTPLAATEVRNGLVRVRLREAGLGWGAQLALRFLDEAP